MAADRRVLIIGLVVMLVLVGVGVVTAALFTASACRDIGPGSVTAGPAAAELSTVLATTPSPELAAAGDHLEVAVRDLARALGPLTGIADVSGATALTTAWNSIVATGPTTTVLDLTGDDVVAAAAFDEPSLLVGDGGRLYSLAYVNPLTGQVDALLPLGPVLDPGTCVDTAVVGEPFAFHLAAGGGELLLFRVEEDSDTPELELRDAVEGRRWTADLEVPIAPPGILAERVTAGLGPDVVVSARRVIAGEPQAAVMAVDRDDGEERWRVRPEAVLADADDDEPRWLEVVGVSDSVAVVAVAPEQARDRATLVAFDLEDGAVRWRAAPSGGAAEVLAVRVEGGQVWVAWHDEGAVELTALDVRDGATLGSLRVPGRTAVLADGIALVGDRVLTLAGAGQVHEVAEVASPLVLQDVVFSQGTTSVLVTVGTSEGEPVPVAERAAVVLTFR